MIDYVIVLSDFRHKMHLVKSVTISKFRFLCKLHLYIGHIVALSGSGNIPHLVR